MGRLIIDGNRVYELDEACIRRKKYAADTRKQQTPQRKKAATQKSENGKKGKRQF